MRFVRNSTLAFAVMIVTGSVGNAAAGSNWRVFTDRFGSSVEYPADVFSKLGKEAANGVTIARPDGRARLRIFSVSRMPADTPRQFLTREFPFDRQTLSYERVTTRFFVVSARRQGRIVYTRCNFAQRVHCIELGYPIAEKRAFDSVTTRVSLSLRPTGR